MSGFWEHIGVGIAAFIDDCRYAAAITLVVAVLLLATLDGWPLIVTGLLWVVILVIRGLIRKWFTSQVGK